MIRSQHNRRRFLKTSSAGILGAGIFGSANKQEILRDPKAESPKITEYRTLGRTGFQVSTLGFGRPGNPAILKAGLKAGINYFDAAPMYGQSEKDIGSIIHEFDRKSIFITTKIVAGKISSKEDVLNSARKSMETLKVDYLDSLQLQKAESLKQVGDPDFHAAIDQLKQEGRVKFASISCHGTYFPGNPEDSAENILMKAVADGRFDILLLVYNFLHHDAGERILKACKEKNIGTTIMKSNPVKMYHLFKELADQYKTDNKEIPERYKQTYENFEAHNEEAMRYLEEKGIADHDEKLRDVATRFVINNPNVHTTLIAFDNFEDLESHIKYAGQPMNEEQLAYLKVY